MSAEVRDIPLDEIFCDSDFNCRGGVIRPIDVIPLAKSISAEGLFQPILLQPWDKVPGKKYRIVAGHRRFTAMKLVEGATSIASIINEKLDDLKARTINIQENIARENLNIKQEARALEHFWKAGWEQTEIAQQFNQTLNWVKVRLDLLRLPEDIQDEAAAGMLTQEQIKTLFKMRGNKDKLYATVRKIKSAKMSGEKRRLDLEVKKVKSLTKKVRTKDEMFKVMDIIQQQTGYNIATRTLAWCAGQISLLEYLRDVEKLAPSIGKSFVMPPEILQDAITGTGGITVGGTDL